MQKTNIELVDYCKKALAERWFYGWGAWGQLATVDLVNRLVNQWPAMNTRWRGYMMKAVHAGNRLCDCYGLVKGFVWLQPDGNFRYNPDQDVNTEGAFHRAIEKGSISTMPEIPGIILWMHGHVAVYIGGGKYIELAGGGVGANLGRVRSSRFTHWFKDTIIDYVNQPVNSADLCLGYIKFLAERGIMRSPEYWELRIYEVPYLNDLFRNMCNFIKGLEK